MNNYQKFTKTLNEDLVDDVGKIQRLLTESFSLMKKNSMLYDKKSTIYKLHKNLVDEHNSFINRAFK